MITKNDSLASVSRLPEFAEMATRIFDDSNPYAAQMGQQTFTDFCAFAGWDPQWICDGYNKLLEIRAAGGQIYYPLYTEEEAAENPAVEERYMVRFPAAEKAPFVVVSAGGGYLGCAAMIEAYPACVHSAEAGIHAFSLNYRCMQNALAPNPIEDLAYAVSYIRAHAEELNVDPDHYAVCGFSAGGHMTACFGAESIGWKKYGLPKPELVALGYPVVMMGEKSHESTKQMFLGADMNNPEMVERYSAEKQVTPDYPKTYVWQCERDSAVPIENTQMLAQALSENGVPHIYTTYDSDFHGWGAGDGTPSEGWVEKAVAFWKE